jgi:hypothetical protein
MHGWRASTIFVCLLIGGCFPRESQHIGAVDPLDNIPAIQEAALKKDQSAVPRLIVLLNDSDPAVRFYAFGALQKITGQDFDYHFYDEADQRRPAIARWQRWLKQRKP